MRPLVPAEAFNSIYYTKGNRTEDGGGSTVLYSCYVVSRIQASVACDHLLTPLSRCSHLYFPEGTVRVYGVRT